MSSIEARSAVFGQDLPLDPAEVAAALTRAAPWLYTNLRHVSDPSARVKRQTWNVGDVAAHLTVVLDTYRDAAEGGASFPVPFSQRQEWIDAGLARISERRPAILVGRIRDDIEALSAVVGSSRPGQVVNWYSGTPATRHSLAQSWWKRCSSTVGTSPRPHTATPRLTRAVAASACS